MFIAFVVIVLGSFEGGGLVFCCYFFFVVVFGGAFWGLKFLKIFLFLFIYFLFSPSFIQLKSK